MKAQKRGSLLQSLLLLSFLLTACSSQTAVSVDLPTATISPSPVVTIATTVVATETSVPPTNTPEATTPNSEKLDIIFTDSQEMNVGGVAISGATSVDATARSLGLLELEIDPNTLDDLSARALHNFFASEGTDNASEAAAWLKACKAGTPAERTAEVYTTTGGMTPEKLQMVMDCGQEIPEGAVAIKGVEFVYGKWFVGNVDSAEPLKADPEMPWLDIVIKSGGLISGMMVDKDAGRLKVFVGLPFNTDAKHAQGRSASGTEVSLDWIIKYPKGLDLKMSNAQGNRALEWYQKVTVTTRP